MQTNSQTENTKQIQGEVSLFLEASTDTDIIIPARFLKRTSLDNFEQFAFFEKKYLPSTICEPTMEDKDFIFKTKDLNPACTLNNHHSKNATFLLTWYNFGCGSSREHAVYALRNFKVIIGSAPKGKSAFADIFRDNCRQNLIWTPVISESNHQKLTALIEKDLEAAPVKITLDVEKDVLIYEKDSNKQEFVVEIPTNHKDYILKAKEPFEMAKEQVLNNLAEIKAWETRNSDVIACSPKA